VIAALLGVVVGALCGGALWVAFRPSLQVAALARTNYRGVPLITAAGVLVPITMVLLAGFVRLMILITDRKPDWDQLIGPSVAAAVGFSLLGLLDDVLGEGQSGGFRGHLAALREGRLTSGMVKLMAGGAVALVVSSGLARGDEGLVGALRDGAVVALAANLANLLDRAPGRAVKACAVAFAVSMAASRSPTLAAPAAGLGAGLALLPDDLSERVMLGDAGANCLGALCGMAALVAVPAAEGRWVLLVALAAANAVSEVVSFSRVIDAVGPLRWFDRLGRRAREG
jgi:hypothetical protein